MIQKKCIQRYAVSVQEMDSSISINLIYSNSESFGSTKGTHGEAMSNSISSTGKDASKRVRYAQTGFGRFFSEKPGDSDSKSIGNDIDVYGATMACILINQTGRTSEASAMSKEDNRYLNTDVYPRAE